MWEGEVITKEFFCSLLRLTMNQSSQKNGQVVPFVFFPHVIFFVMTKWKKKRIQFSVCSLKLDNLLFENGSSQLKKVKCGKDHDFLQASRAWKKI